MTLGPEFVRGLRAALSVRLPWRIHKAEGGDSWVALKLGHDDLWLLFSWGSGTGGCCLADGGSVSALRKGAPARTPLVEALLPDASEDPDIAVEVAAMTRGRLRALKSERARRVMAELIEPTGARGAVRVSAGTEQDWLGALNDLRLVLAQRLGIDSAEAAEDVHAIAREAPPPHESDEFRWRRGAALSYDMLTWWQESLLRVLLRGQGPA
mgnify:FL=1